MNAKLIEKGSLKMHPVKKACFFPRQWLSTEKGVQMAKKRSEFLPVSDVSQKKIPAGSSDVCVQLKEERPGSDYALQKRFE